MTAHVVLPGASRRGSAVQRWVSAAARTRSLLVGLLVFDGAGVPVEVVSPFLNETAARLWADQNDVTTFQVLPARIAGGRE